MPPFTVDGHYLESPDPGSHGHALTPLRFMSGLTPFWANGATGLTPYSFEANPFDASFAPGQYGDELGSPVPSFDLDSLKRAADDEAAGAVLKRPRLDEAVTGVSASTSYAPDADTPSDRGRRASSPPTGSSVAPTPKMDGEPTPPLPQMMSVAPGDISGAYRRSAPPAVLPVPVAAPPPPPAPSARAKPPAKTTVARTKKAPAPRKPRAKGKAKAAKKAAPEPAADADDAMDDDSRSVAGSVGEGGESSKTGGADPEEDKRKHFLERNRKAACKSRARRKEFIRA